VRRLMFPTVLAALLLGFAPGSAVLAQQTPATAPLAVPPGPVSHFATRFDVVDAPAQFDWVLMIIDFPGGAWTPSHAPGGSLYMTVIQGELSTRMAGGPIDTVPAGSTFAANSGEFLKVGNARTGNARVIASVLLPKGAPLMTIEQSDSDPTDGSLVQRPTTAYQSSIAVERPAGAFQLVHMLLDLDPGVWTPRHMHGGQEHILVTEGQLSLQRSGDVEVFRVGESWSNASGLVHAAGNDGGSFAQAAATFLLPAGRPLTSLI
jgi:quercetin dioxygenase-like cupin family protein